MERQRYQLETQCRNLVVALPGVARHNVGLLDASGLALYGLRQARPSNNNKRTTSMFRMRIGGSLLLGVLCGAVVSCVTSPPVQEMSDARQAISAAEQANVAPLAPESEAPPGDFSRKRSSSCWKKRTGRRAPMPFAQRTVLCRRYRRVKPCPIRNAIDQPCRPLLTSSGT